MHNCAEDKKLTAGPDTSSRNVKYRVFPTAGLSELSPLASRVNHLSRVFPAADPSELSPLASRVK